METPSSGGASAPSIELQHKEKPNLPSAPRVPPTAATRACTPIRPVYDDFATAHSSITSRSTSGISREMSTKSPKKQASVLDRGRPLSRRIHKSLRRQKVWADNKSSPSPSLGKLSNRHLISDFDLGNSQTHVLFYHPQVSVPSSRLSVLPKRLSGSLFMNSLKKAIGAKSSPAARQTQSRLSLTLKWPGDSMKLPDLARKVERPDRHALEDGQEAEGSLEIANRASLPDIPFCMHDPFVYDAGQNRVSFGGVVGDRNDIVDDGQHTHKHAGMTGDRLSGVGFVPLLDVPSTHENEHTSHPHHSSLALAVNSEGTLSMRDGSTVDNIVMQYAHNNGLWDISLDSNDEDSEEDDGHFHHFGIPKKHSNGQFTKNTSGNENGKWEENHETGDLNFKRPFRAFKLMESSGQVPSSDLPRIPALTGHQALKSMSEGLGQSSSYGDTRKLLDITERSLLGVNASLSRGDVAGGSTAYKNPFRKKQSQKAAITSDAGADSSPNSHPSQVSATVPCYSMENLTHKPLLALERDISRALRRMSDFSNLSLDVPANYAGDGGFQSSTDSSGLLSFMAKPDQRVIEPLKLVTQGFYHKSALHQTWLDSQRIERVRIPIRRNQSVSSSLTASSSASSAVEEFDLQEMAGQDQNGTEWETVIDGVMSRVKTAGSSLANNSSAGNISPILFEHNDFSSTDRIIQHPAQINYSYDYRYREIKEGKFPVLLPSYKPHTVNGFPANSCRSISPFQQDSGDLYQPPPPLPRSHTNPFRSPPPEVITTKSKSSETLDGGEFNSDSASSAKFGVPYSTTNGNRSGHWMDEFGDPGPAIQLFATIQKSRASHGSGHTISKSYSSLEIIGSSIADASSSALSAIIHDLEIAQDARKDEASKFNFETEPIENMPSAAHGRSVFIKQPPGAFYQGVRSRPEPLRNGSHLDRRDFTRLSQRRAAQSYPTNQIRPLSLLQTQLAESVPSADEDGDGSGRRLSDNFLYRSPLAPIKSKSWCDLYTREQLTSMHIDANIEVTNEPGPTNSRSSCPAFGETLKMDGSWKRTWSPHLRPWPRDNSSIKSDLSDRKRKISSVVLCLCCLFPPMLVLYGVGYLDNMMLWITNGEISSFSKGHKRVALQVVCFFIIVALIVVPITVVVKVTSSE